MKIALGIKNLRRLLTGAVGPTPVNTVAPAVTGTLNQGDTLTTTNGTWSNTPTSYAYQWHSNSANSTVGATAISGATAATFVINVAVGAQYIFCRVTAINANGANNAPSNIVGPTVAVVLGTLALSSNSFTNGTTASGTITGATSGSTIALANGPAGFTINSAARTWAFDGSAAAGSATLTLTEILAGATGSPKANSIGWSVGSASATLDATITAPDFTFTSLTTYPPELNFLLDETTVVDQDNLVIQYASDRVFTAPTSVTIPLTSTNTTGASPIYTASALASITSPAQTYLRARIERGTTSYSNWSSVRKHGDTTAPSITTSTTASFQEGVTGTPRPVSDAWSSGEYVTVALSGTDAGAVEVTYTDATHTGGVFRLASNASPDYETKTSYAFTAAFTDDAGNVTTVNKVWTITNDASDDPVVPFLFSATDKNAGIAVSTDGKTISGTQDQADTMPVRSNKAVTGKKVKAIKVTGVATSGYLLDFGITDNDPSMIATYSFPGFGNTHGVCRHKNANIYPGGAGSGDAAQAVNDIYMVAVDVAAGIVWLGKNGTWFNSGNPGAGTGGTTGISLSAWYLWVALNRIGDSVQLVDTYPYTLPAGFTEMA